MLDDAIANQPDPSSHADELIAETLEESGDGFGDQNTGDQIAGMFDPRIHESDENGNPIFRADGKTFKLKRGRKTGVDYASGERSASVRVSGGGTLADPEVAKRKAAAATAAALLTGVGVAFFGDEWTPVCDKKAGIDERQNLVSAFDAYFEATGTIDLPPSLGLVIAIAGYSLPRLAAPNTKKKMGGIVTALRMKYLAWRAGE